MENIQIRATVDQHDINICHFTVDRPVQSGRAEFNNPEEARGNTLAERLFKIPSVSKVVLDGYEVTVTQSGGQDWRQIGKRIGTAIRLFLNPPQIPEDQYLSPEQLREKVQQILDEQINPGVASHGGFVELLDVQENNIYLRMGGGCQGCGAADMTLRMGIERIIREHIPQVQEILDATDHAAGQNPYYATR